jgi:hypothetical protein
MATFGLVQSFDIDGGALDALSQAEAFTLGVEWGRAWELSQWPAPFTLCVHTQNAFRISAMLVNRGRQVTFGPNVAGFVDLAVVGLQ